jgi:hypothetical protein
MIVEHAHRVFEVVEAVRVDPLDLLVGHFLPHD